MKNENFIEHANSRIPVLITLTAISATFIAGYYTQSIPVSVATAAGVSGLLHTFRLIALEVVTYQENKIDEAVNRLSKKLHHIASVNAPAP